MVGDSASNEWRRVSAGSGIRRVGFLPQTALQVWKNFCFSPFVEPKKSKSCSRREFRFALVPWRAPVGAPVGPRSDRDLK